MTVPTGETVKKLISKVAYKFSSTEVKMLIDKLEENSASITLFEHSRERHSYGGLLHLVQHGRFNFIDRIAIASKMNELHTAATKLAIVETIFEGKQELARHDGLIKAAQSVTTSPTLLTPEVVAKQALDILDTELSKTYKAAIKL